MGTGHWQLYPMPQQRNSIVPIILLGILFFIFGFVTWLNGTLIPYLRIACDLSALQASLVTFAFYISYFVMALPASEVLKRTGLKNGMMLGLLVMAAGALLFIPAAYARSYMLFLVGLFVIGIGLTVLQTASNPYITIVGPIESAAKRISIMGICNKFAGILAPMILGAVVLHDADQLTERLQSLSDADRELQLQELAQRVVGPYGLMALVLAILGVLVRWSPLPEVKAEGEEKEGKHAWGDAFKHPQLVLGVIALFLYVGVEVLAGDSIAVYAQRTGTPLSVAKLLTSVTLTAMLVGYVIGILTIPKMLSQQRALQLSALVGTVFTVCVAWIDPSNVVTLPIFDFSNFQLVQAELPLSVVFVALLGLANALVWPAIWPLAIDGLGPATKTGSALLIMAILGGALVMPVWTLMAGPDSAASAQSAYWLCLPCYLFIGWYAIKGSRLRSW
jgi:MFS transporter, FHS family, L-fucose permease